MAKTLARGLTEIEVAVVKRMRALGLPRDYIFSFISQPGRTITPAFIGEIMNGKIGVDVVPASISTTREFVSSRLAMNRSGDIESRDNPLQPWRIEQALLWARRGFGSLLPSEGEDTEFKLIFKSSSEFKYIKTMIAFSNTYGGYIFFGINDNGKVANFNEDDFNSFNWESFGQKLTSVSSSMVKWDRAVIDIPETPDHIFDGRFIKRLAEVRGIPEDKWRWIVDDSSVSTKSIGVIFAYPSPEPVKTIKSRGAILSDQYYFRDHSRNESVSNVDELPFLRRSRSESERISMLISEIDRLEKENEFLRSTLDAPSKSNYIQNDFF